MLEIIMLFMSSSSFFAKGYEKDKSISQINKCSNYWFPVNVICSNWNSQVQENLTYLSDRLLTNTVDLLK